ncbi:hypothetical protein [Kaistia algarum]
MYKRADQPKAIAYVSLLLADDESSYMTGTSLVVDGRYFAP